MGPLKNWQWRGFTIVEAIVACSLLVLVGAGIATSMDLALRLSQSSNLSFSATAVAESLMEQLRADFIEDSPQPTEDNWKTSNTFLLSYNNASLDIPVSSEDAPQWTDFNPPLPDGRSMNMRVALTRKTTQLPDAFLNESEDVIFLSLDYQWKNPKGIWVRAACPLIAIRYPYS